MITIAPDSPIFALPVEARTTAQRRANAAKGTAAYGLGIRFLGGSGPMPGEGITRSWRVQARARRRRRRGSSRCGRGRAPCSRPRATSAEGRRVVCCDSHSYIIPSYCMVPFIPSLDTSFDILLLPYHSMAARVRESINLYSRAQESGANKFTAHNPPPGSQCLACLRCAPVAVCPQRIRMRACTKLPLHAWRKGASPRTRPQETKRYNKLYL